MSTPYTSPAVGDRILVTSPAGAVWSGTVKKTTATTFTLNTGTKYLTNRLPAMREYGAGKQSTWAHESYAVLTDSEEGKKIIASVAARKITDELIDMFPAYGESVNVDIERAHALIDGLDHIQRGGEIDWNAAPFSLLKRKS